MKPKLVVWIGLIFFLLLGLSANAIFTHLYYSRSLDRMERCTATAIGTGRDTNACSQSLSAADAAYSASSSVNQLIPFVAFLSVVVVTDRLFSNEKRIDDLERRLK
jgi:hypothetical protein